MAKIDKKNMREWKQTEFSIQRLMGTLFELKKHSRDT